MHKAYVERMSNARGAYGGSVAGVSPSFLSLGSLTPVEEPLGYYQGARKNMSRSNVSDASLQCTVVCDIFARPILLLPHLWECPRAYGLLSMDDIFARPISLLLCYITFDEKLLGRFFIISACLAFCFNDALPG